MISSSSFNFQSVTFPLANRTFHSVYLNVRQGETLVACIVESISMAFNLAAHCSLTFHGLLLNQMANKRRYSTENLGGKCRQFVCVQSNCRGLMVMGKVANILEVDEIF